MERPTRFLSIGAGQLGRKIGEAAKRADLEFGVIAGSDQDPAIKYADKIFYGDLKDPTILEQAFNWADSVTLDTEHINAQYCRQYSKLHPDNPTLLFNPDSLALTQNKKAQHLLYEKEGLPIPRIADINDYAQFQTAAERFSNQGVLQAGRDAYDSLGNAKFQNQADLILAWEKLKDRGELFVEEWVDFETELAVMIARGLHKESVTFPLVRSIHQDGILYLAESPARVPFRIAQEAESIAYKVGKYATGVGLLTVELFLDRGGRVLINESCIGRPHNSGHLTKFSLVNSQYDQQVRLAQGKILGSVNFKDGIQSATMINLIGASLGGSEVEGVEEVQLRTGVIFDIYGKTARAGRKLGDGVWVGNDYREGREAAQQAVEMLNGFNNNIFRVYSIADAA